MGRSRAYPTVEASPTLGKPAFTCIVMVGCWDLNSGPLDTEGLAQTSRNGTFLRPSLYLLFGVEGWMSTADVLLIGMLEDGAAVDVGLGCNVDIGV